MFLDRFGEFYAPEAHHGAMKLVAAAAAHHRLMWIHPFLDGNGRVARLFIEAYFHRIPVHGFWLWSVSRGLARRNVDYKSALAGPSPPQERSGRKGNLSNQGLIHFCRFFLEVLSGPGEYMGGLLRLQKLVERIRRYAELRSSGMISGPAAPRG
jgi:Fic family protein